jgi:hypothetical protein
MSEKAAKPKKAKAKTATAETGVLGSLPATRATRVGGERSRSAASAKPAAKPKPKPKAAAKPKPKPAAKPKVPSTPAPQPATPHRPRPVRAGAPALEDSTGRARAESAEPREQRPTTPPTGTELVTTAIQAAGELAQIGLTVGGQVLKRAVKRLPKP